MVTEGIKNIKDDDSKATNIFSMVYDIDAVSSYPSNTQAANISKETTRRELVDIEGFSKDFFKLQNINLVAGSANTIEYCSNMFKFHTLSELEKAYLEKKK